MFLLAHIGIPLGLYFGFVELTRLGLDPLEWGDIGSLDVRLLIIGSVLPDVLGKPLVLFGFSGRAVFHSVTFVLLVYLGTKFFSEGWRYQGLAIGAGIHLVLDSMWESPKLLFWPFLSTEVPRASASFGDWVIRWRIGQLKELNVFLGELIGLLLILGVIHTYNLYRLRKAKKLVREGRINKK